MKKKNNKKHKKNTNWASKLANHLQTTEFVKNISLLAMARYYVMVSFAILHCLVPSTAQNSTMY